MPHPFLALPIASSPANVVWEGRRPLDRYRGISAPLVRPSPFSVKRPGPVNDERRPPDRSVLVSREGNLPRITASSRTGHQYVHGTCIGRN